MHRKVRLVTHLLIIFSLIGGFLFTPETASADGGVVISDPELWAMFSESHQIAVVKLPPMWYGESRWEIYLPEGEYVMRLGTRQIDDQLTSLVLGPDKERFPPAVGQTPIGAGHHRIELMRSEEWRGREITVLLDDRPVIEAEEEPDWNTGGTSTGASEIGDCVQRPAHEPLVLYRRRFYLRQKGGQYVAPKGPTEGLMLWIEPVEPADAPRADAGTDSRP